MFSRAFSTASGSTSIAETNAAPSFAATIASTPDPVPTSITVRRRASGSAAGRCTAASIDGDRFRNRAMARSRRRWARDPAGALVTSGDGMSHGGATITRPTRIAGRSACVRRAQSSSSTSAGSIRPSAAADCAIARRRPARVDVPKCAVHSGGDEIVFLDGDQIVVGEQRDETVAGAAVMPSGKWTIRAGDARSPKMSFTRSKNGFSADSLPSPSAALGQRPAELFEELLLFLGQLLRHRDASDDVEVAVAAARDVRHALAAQLKRAPGCVPAGTSVPRGRSASAP